MCHETRVRDNSWCSGTSGHRTIARGPLPNESGSEQSWRTARDEPWLSERDSEGFATPWNRSTSPRPGSVSVPGHLVRQVCLGKLVGGVAPGHGFAATNAAGNAGLATLGTQGRNNLRAAPPQLLATNSRPTHASGPLTGLHCAVMTFASNAQS